MNQTTREISNGKNRLEELATTRYSLLVLAVGITLVAASIAIVVSDEVAAEEPQANLPLFTGFYDGQEVQYVVTDITDPDSEEGLIYTPALLGLPESAVADVYRVTNGPEGQKAVFDTIPGDENYSPLWEVNLVTWEEGVTPLVLRSVEEILTAESQGLLVIDETSTIINCPIIVWPGGQLPRLPV